jgi:hypothetical protein
VSRVPIAVSIVYLGIFAGVLVRNVWWPVWGSDRRHLNWSRCFPIGLLLSVSYPGERTGAFVAVSLAAVSNAVVIFYISRWIIRRISN